MGQANYSSAKAGLIGLTKATRPRARVARDHRQRRRARVRPDRADPGPPRGAPGRRSPSGRRSAASGRPRRSPNAVAFLASDEAGVHHRPGARRRRRPGDDVARLAGGRRRRRCYARRDAHRAVLDQRAGPPVQPDRRRGDRASPPSSTRAATSTSTSSRRAARRASGSSHVVETHLHNDYVSGGRDLAALTGATHVIGAGAALRYEHRGLGDGGTLRCRPRSGSTALDTPGHTPEHVSYTVADTSRGGRPGAAVQRRLAARRRGRPDGPARRGERRARSPTRCTTRSTTCSCRSTTTSRVHPTHGAGSLCSTGIGDDADDDDRARAPPRPAARADGRRRLRPRAARRPAGDPALLRADATDRTRAGRRSSAAGCRRPPALDRRPRSRRPSPAGRQVVDARPAAAPRRRAHPGVAVDPARRSFGTWLGWVVDLDRPVVLVVASGRRPRPADAPGHPDRP